MDCKTQNINTNFTLIELIIVISIIALLASMLLPAMQKARLKGVDIACRNQLRQSGLSCTFYADDNDGWMFTFCSTKSWGQAAGVKDHKTIACPSAESQGDFNTYGAFLNTIYTDVNLRVPHGTGFDYFTRIVSGKRKNPAEDFYLADSATASGTQTRYFYPYINNFNHSCRRHSKHVNLWFMDGHTDGCNVQDLKALNFTCFRLPNGSLIPF